jgi:acyl-coenzyme A thioesterase PaaI-like protein
VTFSGPVPIGNTFLGDHAGTVRDLGLATDVDGPDALVGTAATVPEFYIPGTDVVRPSILVTFADIVAGKFANAKLAPSICVTLDLDLHLLRSPAGEGFRPGDEIRCRSAVVRAGRRIVVMGFEIMSGTGAMVGFGHAGFMASPNPEHVAPDGFGLVTTETERWRLTVPFAERAGIRRLADGRVELPFMLDNINASGGLQGGVLALCVEEAVLTARPGAEVTSMSLRYLRGFRRTAAIAEATVHGSVARVDLVNESGELGAVAVVSLRS